jgi:L-alanine-DL-glutamate epimerase-like enolase superfamily enzyme
MKISAVELFVLKSPGLYRSPEGAEEAPGPTYLGFVKVSTGAGISGYSDMETAPSVAKAVIQAPRWSEAGMECFDGLASLLIGENPLEVERLWYKMYRGSIYYGRRGVAIQAISAIDIALWDIAGNFYQTPVHMLLGAKWRDRVRTYASTLFRPEPDAMRQAARKYVDQGFTAVKFGWGVFGRNRSLDLNSLKRLARNSAMAGIYSHGLIRRAYAQRSHSVSQGARTFRSVPDRRVASPGGLRRIPAGVRGSRNHDRLREAGSDGMGICTTDRSRSH